MLEQESSLIRRPLPLLVRQALLQRQITDDQIIVATDTDLDIAGEYGESWVVVTKDHVLVFRMEEEDDRAILIKEVDVDLVKTARTDTRVGSGFLEVKTSEVFEELARFSNRNAEKFGKVASRIKALALGKPVDATAEEEVIRGRCQMCGVRLPDRQMRLCPKCLKRGAVFMRFVRQTRAFWPHAALAMVLVVFTILIQLVPAQLTCVLVDNVFQGKPLTGWFARLSGLFGYGGDHRTEWLYLLVGGLAITTALGAIIQVFRETLATWIANRLAFDLRRQVFRKLEDLSIKYHDENPLGHLMTRCTQDIEALQGFINQMTSGFGFQLIMVVSVTVVMFTMSWKLTLWAVCPAPIVMIATIWYYKRIIPQWHKYWTTRSTLSNVLHGSLNGIRVVKAFAQEQRESQRFDTFSAKFRDAGLYVGYMSSRFYPVIGFMFQLGGYGVWLLSGYTIINAGRTGTTPELSVGVVIAFLAYLNMFYGPLNSLTQMSTWFTSFATQAQRVFEVLDEDPEIAETPDSVDIEIQGAIEFKEIGFGYDPHIPILHDVSLRVSPGEMIGVVGHSGSGKSTAVNLIMRFYEPQEGSITVDNIDIRKIKKHCLRRQIGYVAQDPFLFRGTIADNISYGNPKVAPEAILNAALAANAHMFITRTHDGYDARLGDRGSGLSGGERQRVAIARGLLHNPRVLILDEATSSVDTIAEREIQKALEALSLGRTTIAVAHRLSTLRNCDRILVFEEGQIREQGTHEQLVALKGIYHKLVEIQTQLTRDRDTAVDGLKALDDLAKAEVEAKPAPVEAKAAERQRLEVPQIRYLEPKEVEAVPMEGGGMRVKYRDEVYGHVRAYRCFPISRPSEFIALWTGDSALEHREIGVARWLKELNPPARTAVEQELAKRYFIHYVHSIQSIEEDLAFLTWKVETDKGPMEFLTKRWDRDTIVEGGRNCRIVFDIDNNRYEIEDLDALDPDSKDLYHRFIYW